MAYDLQFDGVNDYVSIPSGMTLSSVGDYFEFESDIVNNIGYYFSGASHTFGHIFAYDTTKYRLRVSTSGTVSEITAPVPSGRTIIRITREAAGYDLIVDGSSLGSLSQPAGLSPIILGLWSVQGSASSLRLYSFEYGNTSGAIRYYDPSATGGTGSVLKDTVGTNNGTLVNFPTNDSQWVEYANLADNFTRLGSLTAPSVTGSASDLPTLVKYEDFTSTMLANLDSGGGDLRFSSDEAGTTQLACEVVTFTKATGDVVWVKVPSVTTGALIYVWGDNTGASQPAVGAAFGRNATWSDYALRNHFSTASPLIDSTGLATLTPTNVTYGTGIIDGSVVSNGSNSAIGTGQTYSLGTGDFSFSAWVKIPASSAADAVRVVFGNGPGAGSFNSNWMLFVGGGTLTLFTVQSSVTRVDGTISVADDAWHYITATRSGTSHSVYVDGVLDASNTGTVRNISDTITEKYFTESYDGWEKMLGDLDESALLKSAVPAAQLLIEYDNQSATGAWWTATDEPSGGAIELTPTTINSNSQSFNPLIQYASLLALSPGVVDSSSSSLNPVIQYSASLLLAPSVINSTSSALNPTLQYASVVLLEPSVVNSSSSTLNPNISFSAALNILPTIVNSTSSSLDPVVNYTSILNIAPSVVNSNSVSFNPSIDYTSILNIAPNVVNSNSVSFNPSIDYTSALILSPVTVDSSSVSLDPLVEYKAVINITAQVINSSSVSLNPSISTGATQDVGLVSAGFAADLYSVKYEPSGVTASYQLSNISVNFKG